MAFNQGDKLISLKRDGGHLLAHTVKCSMNISFLRRTFCNLANLYNKSTGYDMPRTKPINELHGEIMKVIKNAESGWWSGFFSLGLASTEVSHTLIDCSRLFFGHHSSRKHTARLLPPKQAQVL